VPRIVRDARLESATARARLTRERFHWLGVARGLALGYRRSKRGYGSWYARVLADQAAGRYDTRAIGAADDHEAADGVERLSFLAAREKVHLFAKDAGRGAIALDSPYTVARAAEDYLEWFGAQRKSLTSTKGAIEAHVLPKLGHRLAAELTKDELERWHRKLATTAARARAPRGAKKPVHRDQDLADPETIRRRRATANRLLSILRALLNRAWRNGKVASNAAWARLEPFRNANEPRVRYLPEDQARHFVNACAQASGKGLQRLVRGALMTGCRYSELASIRVDDYRAPFSGADAGAVYIRESKNGRPRSVPLTDEGVAFFDELSAGRPGTGALFLRDDGAPWAKNHQVRPLKAASSRAKIQPAVNIHVLRHTYGAWLAQRGVPLQVIAAALGHSDTRITEKHYGHLSPNYIAQTIRAHLPQLSPAAPAKVQPIRTAKKRKGIIQ
jgi:integrase